MTGTTRQPWFWAIVGIATSTLLFSGCPSRDPSDGPGDSEDVVISPGDDSTASNTALNSEGGSGAVPADTQSTGIAANDEQQGDAGSESTTTSSLAPDGKEHLFQGWDKPEFALLVSGRQHGYIEPCGCTGLANQKGGLLRRHTLIKQLLDKEWDIVPVDAGNQVRRFGIQPVVKLSTSVRGLSQVMEYQGIGFGPDDLKLPGVDLFQAIENNIGDENPFVSANVDILGGYPEKFRVITVGEVKIGITTLIGDRHVNRVENPDVEVKSAKKGLDEVWPLMEQEECDFYLLIAHAPMDETYELAKSFPRFDVIVTSGELDMPQLQPEVFDTGSRTVEIIQTGIKGMYVGVLGVYRGESGFKFRFQRIPLDSRFEDSPELKQVFKDYQEELRVMGLEGLGLRPVLHPSTRSYVGSESCGDCHSLAYDVWENGPNGEGGVHFHATDSLTDPTERTWVTRIHDPECLSCHVTGWNPQKYFPFETGYVALDQSEPLLGNGCENCHGPGSQHVAAEEGSISVEDEDIQKFRDEMRVTLQEAKESLCLECHDLDNSPDFHVDGAFDEYWSQVVHKGVD